jgi:hypothetical protein
VPFAFVSHGSEKLRAQQQALDARFRGMTSKSSNKKIGSGAAGTIRINRTLNP